MRDDVYLVIEQYTVLVSPISRLIERSSLTPVYRTFLKHWRSFNSAAISWRSAAVPAPACHKISEDNSSIASVSCVERRYDEGEEC